MKPVEPKELKELKCKKIGINIEKMEPAEPKGLKEFKCKRIENNIEEEIIKNKKITVCSCEIECIMKRLEPEKKGKSTYWYRGVYVFDPKNKNIWYGVKKIGFLILNNHNYPSHDFTPSVAERWLEDLGFDTGQDETAPKSGWKKEDMSGWMKKYE
jgi:hypothetical protein